MDAINIIAQRFKSSWFPSKDDKIWKKWVDFKERNSNDLAKLLSSDIKDDFKKRAIFLLLVPSKKLNPIYWKGRLNYAGGSPKFIKNIPANLLGEAIILINNFTKALDPKRTDYQMHQVTKTPDFELTLPIVNEANEALGYYNKCLLELLTVLPIEQGEKIFSNYSLRDITYWESMEDCSGYTPFLNLMLRNDIAEYWKELADLKMQSIIKNEMSGKTKPRQKCEKAIYDYIRTINCETYDKPTYSNELLVKQITFMINTKPIKDTFSSGVFNSLFKRLNDPIYKNLRYEMSKLAILENENFWMYSDDDHEFIKRIKTEFGDSDKNLFNKIEELIAQEKNRDLIENASIVANQKAEELLLSTMK